jgi:glycosyltransferase involved in cell wall biosynthesis
MKISYITLYDELNIHKWSGSGYYIAKTLIEQNAELDFIGTKNVKVDPLSKLKTYYYRAINKKYNFKRSIAYTKRFAEICKMSLKENTDIIFSPGSIALSELETNIPKVFYTDATFQGLIDFYETYTNLSKEMIQEGHYLETKALESCALAIYSSEWAAKSAIDYYHIAPEKVKVVPFGANIESNRNLADIKTIVSNRSRKECTLLFIGVDWERKGGDLAVKVAGELNRQGLKTKLHVVGIRNLDESNLPDFVINHGFISKANEEGREKIDKLLAESHFLIVPSKAEAFGIVFCEASSFGLPSLSTNVGGITSAIRDDINGKTFSPDKDEKAYAQFILDRFHNFSDYESLAYSSFHEFEDRLNWKVSGAKIMNHLKSL